MSHEQRSDDQQAARQLTRREFLATSAGVAGAAALGMVAGGCAGKEAAGPVKSPMRTLGRTGLTVTAFSLGGIGANAAVLKAGLDKGVNFIHCAPGYGTLPQVAEAIAGRRDKVFLGLKYERAGFSDLKYIDRSLQALKVDAVDILFFPLIRPDDARDRKHLEFFEQVKKRRQARFIGITAHANVPATMQAAVEAGFWDVLMPSYSPEARAREALRPVLDQAEKNNLGVVAMKTMTGVRPGEVNHLRTILKEVLADSSVTTLVKGMLTFELFEALWGALGMKATPAESAALQRHLAALGGQACLVCGNCPTCPRGVAVFDVVRAYDYYYTQGGCAEFARTVYAELPASARGGACDGCGECNAHCPYGVDIARRVQAAETMLA